MTTVDIKCHCVDLAIRAYSEDVIEKAKEIYAWITEETELKSKKEKENQNDA